MRSLLLPVNRLTLIELTADDAITLSRFVREHRERFTRQDKQETDLYRTPRNARQVLSERTPGKLKLGLWDGTTLLGGINLTDMGRGNEAMQVMLVDYYVGKVDEERMIEPLRVASTHAISIGYPHVAALVHPDDEETMQTFSQAGYQKKRREFRDQALYRHPEDN